MLKGAVIWLTGLPSSGKTTLAGGLARSLEGLGAPVEVLDGDDLRKTLSADLGFSSEDRREQARRVVWLSQLLSRHGVTVIVPLISPYRESREYARGQLHPFIEVYVKCPLEVCIDRDAKGLYARAMAGEICGFTGISAPYEPPESPEVVVETDIFSEEECCRQILAAVARLAPAVYPDHRIRAEVIPGVQKTKPDESSLPSPGPRRESV